MEDRRMSRTRTSIGLLWLSVQVLALVDVTVEGFNVINDIQISDRLQPRRRQSQATLLSHKQNLLTGSANSHLPSPYNQFYLTNSVNSPHNGKSQSHRIAQVVMLLAN